MFLHNLQELDYDFGARSHKHLSLSFSFSVDHALQAVVQNRDSNHFVFLVVFIWIKKIFDYERKKKLI